MGFGRRSAAMSALRLARDTVRAAVSTDPWGLQTGGEVPVQGQALMDPHRALRRKVEPGRLQQGRAPEDSPWTQARSPRAGGGGERDGVPCAQRGDTWAATLPVATLPPHECGGGGGLARKSRGSMKSARIYQPPKKTGA